MGTTQLNWGPAVKLFEVVRKSWRFSCGLPNAQDFHVVPATVPQVQFAGLEGPFVTAGSHKMYAPCPESDASTILTTNGFVPAGGNAMIPVN
jgi:hypothetical protein